MLARGPLGRRRLGRGERLLSREVTVPRTPHVAYFCMEFGLHESFPIYAGGLGVLAGDFVKAAHDLKLPVVGVGLRWERGYGVQRIGADGKPFDEYPSYDAGFLRPTGVHVRVRVRGVEVPCAVLVAEGFGNVPLFLIEPERAQDRWITHRLYEAGTDVRLAQEMLLGIGGMRALNWLGIPIATYHFNEGHAVFAGIEMIAEAMARGAGFPKAWEETRRRIVFTTHTPVKAGNEEHAIADLRRMGATLELSGAEMREIGGDPFNMTVAGLRLSRIANAVSELHGQTARAMWAHVDGAAPILSVTNGVHTGTWQSPRIRDAARDPNALWEAHRALKDELLAEVAARKGARLDRDALVVGFARRAAGYKRADLITRDEPALAKLLERQPLVFLFSGKAHPDDAVGKGIITRLAAAEARHPGRIFFVENYDLTLARALTRGCDVWLNHPVRPLEASGTSGMKAAMNGVLNASILDGWWPEGCVHGENGWAIGDEQSGDDARDLAAFHATFANDILPAWNDRPRWLRMMQASIAMGVERFSAERMVREYFEKMYGPLEAPAPPAPRAAAPRVPRTAAVVPSAASAQRPDADAAAPEGAPAS